MAPRIHVLYLQPAPLFGGAERQAAHQAFFLPSLGIDVSMIAGPGHAIRDWLQGAPVQKFVHSANFPGGWPSHEGPLRLLRPFRYLTYGFRARAEIAQLVKEIPTDVIVASLPFAWITGSLVARRTGIPIIWRAGGSRINWLQRVSLWLLTRFLRPDWLLCNGEAVRRTFAPLVPAPVAILPNGVDTDVFGPGAGDRERYRPSSARVVVGYAGRLARSKHPQEIIGLTADLKKLHPEVRVLVAGEGTEREACERKARELGLDNITFLGFVADMPSFYAACDIVFLPSSSEGCSNVLLEAMVSAKAVVVADIPPVLELVSDDQTGLVFPFGNQTELTSAVLRLIAHPELRRALAENARKRALDFTVTAAVQGLANLLRLVAANAAKPVPSPRAPASRSLSDGQVTPAPEVPARRWNLGTRLSNQRDRD